MTCPALQLHQGAAMPDDYTGPRVVVADRHEPIPRLRPLDELPEPEEGPATRWGAMSRHPEHPPVQGRPFVRLKAGTPALPISIVAALDDDTAQPSWWAQQVDGDARLLVSDGGWGTLDAAPVEVARWSPEAVPQAPAVGAPESVEVLIGSQSVVATRLPTGRYSIARARLVAGLASLGADVLRVALRQVESWTEGPAVEERGDSVQARIDAVRARIAKRGAR